MKNEFESFQDLVHNRRSVRKFLDSEHIAKEDLKKAIELAHLAPNSSNLQLWEFYQVGSGQLKDKLAEACFNQSAAKTANCLMVFVIRPDFWKKHAKLNYEFIESWAKKMGTMDRSSTKMALNYYQKLIPFLYRDDSFGLMTMLRAFLVKTTGLFKPMFREVGRADKRVVAHKSCALAAENFMLAMKALGYDTCPMEGFDSKMVKRILNLPAKSEITMIVACGRGDENGIYGPRFRVPLKNLYHVIS